MTTDCPRRYLLFCCPCPREECGARYQCAPLPDDAFCARSMEDAPVVTFDDAEKAARERWGWYDGSTSNVRRRREGRA